MFEDEDEDGYADYEITDIAYFGSTVGNAFHSGLTFEQLWSCVYMAPTRESMDAAVSATIRLNEIVDAQSGRNAKSSDASENTERDRERRTPVNVLCRAKIRILIGKI